MPYSCCYIFLRTLISTWIWYTNTGESPLCQFSLHWRHWWLLLWQPPEPPVMTKLASWKLSVFSVGGFKYYQQLMNLSEKSLCHHSTLSIVTNTSPHIASGNNPIKVAPENCWPEPQALKLDLVNEKHLGSKNRNFPTKIWFLKIDTWM